MGDNFYPTVIPRPLPRSRFYLKEAVNWSASFKPVASHEADDTVTDVRFSPVEPFELASAHGFSVSLMNPQGGHIRKTLSRFKDRPYSVDYKKDGRLLAVGVGDGTSAVFDVANRAMLRKFQGHKSAVRNVRFSSDGLRVLTASDDSTVRAWDLGTANYLFSLRDSKDRVRAQAVSPVTEHVWLTGSYDGEARLYDLRSQECVLTLNHGSQIDDVLFLPGGTRAVTVGGTDVRVWDFFAGARVVARITSHAKAVMCGAVRVHEDSVSLATGGLDGHVKFHDTSAFGTKGYLTFRSQVLSVDVATDGRQIAAGLADGRVEIRGDKGFAPKQPTAASRHPFKDRELDGLGRGFVKLDDISSEPYPGTARYFKRGPSAVPSDRDVLVRNMPRPKLEAYDKCLKSFKMGEALDLAVGTKQPSVLCNVVQELVSRGSLRSTLGSREVEELHPLLRIVQKHVRDPQFTDRLLFLLNMILDVHAEGLGTVEDVDAILNDILTQIRREVAASKQLSIIRGAAETILTAASGN